MIPSDVRLYTWLDVQEVLTRSLEGNPWPDWLVDVRAYWDGLWVRTTLGHYSSATAWLEANLDPRLKFLGTGPVIVLESSLSGRTFPISIDETSELSKLPRLRPTLERPHVLTRQLRLKLEPKAASQVAPTIFAFHSFKGGVGRTLHAMALASSLADKGKSVLLIDADFEAPGITWMLQSRLPSAPVSFADYLAIAHSEPVENSDSATELVASRLQDAFLKGIFVLPAFRSLTTFQTLDIRPEDLIQGSDDSFLLTTMLYSLALKLGTDVVIVDLRAGLSELSAGLLLDPRINRVLVTSTSAQSISGTEVVLGLLAKKAPSTLDEHPVPVVILNQVPAEANREALEPIEERILRSIANSIDREQDDVLVTGLRGPTWFDANLLSLPPDWDDVISVVSKTSVAKTVEGLAQLVPRTVSATPTADIQLNDANRKSLRDIAGSFVVAETSEGDDFLPIVPLRRLVEDHSTMLPNSVIVGAKGAGKTYTYLQVLRRRSWRDFALAAGASRSTLDAGLCPVLQPRNLTSSLWLKNKTLDLSARLGLNGPLDQFAIGDIILESLGRDIHQGEWRELWLDVLAWSVGFEPHGKGAGRRLPDYLKSVQQRVLFLFDGLEDIFQDIASDERQQIALRALLQDVPNWLDQTPERSIGMLIFVRRDLVAAAIRQNPAQLMARYEPYALKWNSTEALRLVAWVASKAKVLQGPGIEKISELEQDQLVEILLPIWGRKLGNDRSREGRSAEWVLAALSDFRGQIQARDIVRLMRIAAASSIGGTGWSDRLLMPQAIRDAVAECSTEKIREISEENSQLKRVFGILRALPSEVRSIPFASENVGLNAQDLVLLETNGVVVSYEHEYFMPEIFRRGLDFRLPQGARPRVLALARQRQNDS